MSWDSEWPHFVMRGSASPERQVEYLRQCLHVKSDELADAQMELQTLRLEYQLELKKLQDQITILTRGYRSLPTGQLYPRKARWWQFKKRRLERKLYAP